MEYKKQTKTKKSCGMVVYHIIKFYLKRKNKTITRIVSLAYHVKIYKKKCGNWHEDERKVRRNFWKG